MPLLDEPHHDGSPAYVDLGDADRQAPELGDTVTLRMASSPADPIDAVWIRTTYDAEPTFHECSRGGDGSWTGSIPVHNPVTHYRFLIVRGERQEWLTGAGLADRDVPDALDFKISAHPPGPRWARHGVVYQVFPDRFARSAAADARDAPGWALPADWDDEVVFELDDPRTAAQLYGGDLDGITDHLDHVAEVGADIVYTTPVFPGESNHRYNASTFAGVEPLLGGEEAYVRLSEAVHARGWRIIGDLTTNHTGDTHEWFRRASTDPGSRERGYYYFDDDGGYECWMGFTSLPKINHADPQLRSTMVEGPDSVVGRYLQAPYDLDGWRIDVANMTGRLGAVDVNHEVARAVRRTAEALREDPWVIGEHNHDATSDVNTDGWHGIMNYSGFSWPVWSWLIDPASPARPFGRPVRVPRRPGPLVVQALREWQGSLGWGATAGSWNILGSHDSPRIRTLVGDPAVHRVAAGLQFTLPGVPMVFAGDEIGLEGITGEDARRPMPWHRREEWDTATMATYSALAGARRAHPALRDGGLRWAHVDDDTICYVREHAAGSVLVTARRAGGAAFGLPYADATLLLSTEPGAPEAVGAAAEGPLLTLHLLP